MAPVDLFWTCGYGSYGFALAVWLWLQWTCFGRVAMAAAGDPRMRCYGSNGLVLDALLWLLLVIQGRGLTNPSNQTRVAWVWGKAGFEPGTLRVES